MDLEADLEELENERQRGRGNFRRMLQSYSGKNNNGAKNTKTHTANTYSEHPNAGFNPET
jgi:hypothetical protein